MEPQQKGEKDHMKELLSRPRLSLSGTQLKYIACISMLIDHFAASVLTIGLLQSGRAAQEVWSPVIWGMRMIGRLAFPIYCFLLVEGFQHTHDFWKYAKRMLLFALVSELPFDWAFYQGIYFGHQNVYFTLFLGLLAMEALEKFRIKEGGPTVQGILGAAACVVIAGIIRCDYDVMGLALILALYLSRREHKTQCITGAVFSAFEPVAPLAFLLVWLYHGERGHCSRAEQWGFYLFYPVHILILGAITNLLLLQ